MIPLAAPQRGPWRYRTPPESFMIGGAIFRRARWSQPYPGVVAQYREDVPRASRHLKVYAPKVAGLSGWWEIDHIDTYNPDRGAPLQHFFVDHPVGRALRVGAPILLHFL